MPGTSNAETFDEPGPAPGHSITLRAIKRFQRLGRHMIAVVGTMTAMIGDISDRASGRPRKSAAEVAAAAKSYAEQAFAILDPAPGGRLGRRVVPVGARCTPR